MIVPHIQFDGNAREAMEFYAEVLEGDVAFTTYAERGETAGGDQVWEARLRFSGGVITASDLSGDDRELHQDEGGRCPAWGSRPRTFIDLVGDDEEELEAWFDDLSALPDGTHGADQLFEEDGGVLRGRCVDRFGVGWIVTCLPD